MERYIHEKYSLPRDILFPPAGLLRLLCLESMENTPGIPLRISSLALNIIQRILHAEPQRELREPIRSRKKEAWAESMDCWMLRQIYPYRGFRNRNKRILTWLKKSLLLYCTCQGHFKYSLATLGVVLYGIYKILTYVCIETLTTLSKKKNIATFFFFSKNEGVIFASQCFGGGVRTRDSSPPVYSLKTKLLQAVFRPSYAQSPTNDSIRLKVNHIGNILNYLKGNDGLGIYDKSLVDLGVVLGKQLLPFIDDRPSNFELINIDHYFMCRRETVVISLTVNLA